jgi:5'-methylthioinosine phosphorylase
VSRPLAAIGLIGGTGLDDWGTVSVREEVDTPYGSPSAGISVCTYDSTRLLFLPRHGYSHRIPPHRVNSRANLWALREFGVDRVIAVNAVGGISGELRPGTLCLPDQLIDYTWGREQTYSDDAEHPLRHVDFTNPFEGLLRKALLTAAESGGVSVVDGGCLGVAQGPRLESAAEIRRMRGDGCDMVGMTSMPEAALARELGLDYACIAVISNPAAGLSEAPITMEKIERTLAGAMNDVRKLIGAYLDYL